MDYYKGVSCKLKLRVACFLITKTGDAFFLDYQETRLGHNYSVLNANFSQ